MVNKMRRRGYSKSKIQSAGAKIIKAYEQFEKVKKQNDPSPGQITIDDLLNKFGGRVIE